MSGPVIVIVEGSPAQGQSSVQYVTLSPMEGTCYTQLQPVTLDLSIGSLIASSTNMCLVEDVDSSCSGYGPVSSQSFHPCNYSDDDSQSLGSPQSVYEEELSDIQEILQQRMSGSKDDDDDASVMFDCLDLAFLDENSREGSHDLDIDTVSERRLDYEAVSGGGDVGPSSQLTLHRPRTHLRTTPTPTATTHHRYNRHSSSGWLHYYDTCLPTVTRHDNRFPPTPSPSPHRNDAMLSQSMSMTDMDDGEEDDNDNDAEYKPYCDSRRGAKKNLLWKFLLWVLDHHQDLAQWTDIKRGQFKFVDTVRVSCMWGQRKHKRDMTFEKLSRGIRHYYKRGLMERMPNTRLVYKFNWDKVPKRFRKA